MKVQSIGPLGAARGETVSQVEPKEQAEVLPIRAQDQSWDALDSHQAQLAFERLRDFLEERRIRRKRWQAGVKRQTVTQSYQQLDRLEAQVSQLGGYLNCRV